MPRKSPALFLQTREGDPAVHLWCGTCRRYVLTFYLPTAVETIGALSRALRAEHRDCLEGGPPPAGTPLPWARKKGEA